MYTKILEIVLTDVAIVVVLVIMLQIFLIQPITHLLILANAVFKNDFQTINIRKMQTMPTRRKKLPFNPLKKLGEAVRPSHKPWLP